MKLAIMQPYFFPYIGYFQLINAVDTFVIYDDVNFMKGGWINRNFILYKGEKTRFSLQLQGASPNVLINQVMVGNNRDKLLRSIHHAYSKASEYSSVYPLVEEILMFEEKNLSKYLEYSLRKICDFLNITTEWCVSSDLKKDNSLRGQDKVIAICEELNANHYINVQGGKELYDVADFREKGLTLSFIKTIPGKYTQFRGDFVSSLSILDVMMFNNKEQCSLLLEGYTLD